MGIFRDRYNGELTLLSVTGLFIVIVFGLIFILVSIINHLAFYGHSARIEQLRKDMKNVSIQASEDVMGQVTKWNQDIANMKVYNKFWWADLFIPDAWNDVEFINIEERK